MPYAEGRTYHDADSHVMETPDWLVPYADPGVRERPRALDLLGFSSQLVFNTFLNPYLLDTERKDDPDFAYGLARAHNRAMVDFCSVDRRLLATGYVPLADFERARAMAEEAIAMGTKALLIPSACPARHSPSHVGLFPVWEIAQEARIPIVLHVGGGGQLLDPHYFANGLPPVPDFHGGAENFRSVDYMAIPFPPMQTLSTLIIDGILDRFPRLKIGVIEQGAVWVPSWMRQLDTTVAAFSKNEERLKRLQLRASEAAVLLRQLRGPDGRRARGMMVTQRRARRVRRGAMLDPRRALATSAPSP